MKNVPLGFASLENKFSLKLSPLTFKIDSTELVKTNCQTRIGILSLNDLSTFVVDNPFRIDLTVPFRIQDNSLIRSEISRINLTVIWTIVLQLNHQINYFIHLIGVILPCNQGFYRRRNLHHTRHLKKDLLELKGFLGNFILFSYQLHLHSHQFDLDCTPMGSCLLYWGFPEEMENLA